MPSRTRTFERYQWASIRSRNSPGSVRASTRSRTSRTSSKYEAVSGCDRGVAAVRVRDPVVDRVVGQDRDRAGREVGGHDEHVVLQAPAALGEAQPVLLQEGPAEELVRREQREERVRGAGARASGCAGRARARPSACGRRPCPGRCRRRRATAAACSRSSASLVEPVVVVDVEDVVAARRVGADVARAPRPARVRDADRRDVRVLGGERLEPLARAVGGAVVDEDRLVLVGGQRLPEQRGDARVDREPGL